MACPCCCPCEDGSPLSVFVTIQNMNGIVGRYSPAGVSALQNRLLGNTYQLTRELIDAPNRICSESFVYQDEGPNCNVPFSSICIPAYRSIYMVLGRLSPGRVNSYNLLIGAWSVTSPCVVVAGRHVTYSPVFEVLETQILCGGGSASVELWNSCNPGPQSTYKIGDALLEW